MKRFAIYLLTAFSAIIQLSAKTYSVAEVPNVHLADSARFTSNPDGILSPQAVASLDRTLSQIRRSTSAEAVVVVVDDIEGGDIDSFATELFEEWGLGKADKDNGLLILVAKDLRRAAIRPGYGLEGVLPDITCGRILRGSMFPNFKNGDYDAGLLQGVSKIAEILQDPSNTAEILSNEPDKDFASGDDDGSLAEFFHTWLIFAAVLTAILLLVLILALRAQRGKPLPQRYQAISGLKPLFLALSVVGLGVPLLAALPLVIVLWRWRNAPHKCTRCGAAMKKIDEVHDNEFLNRAQDMEEQVGSVDYDVWHCPTCGQTEIEQYLKHGSPFTECPVCHARTMALVSDRQVRPAAVGVSGIGERTYRCFNCNHHHTDRYTIPALPVPVIIPGGRGGGGGFGGGGSFGGGFGGGHTGGGGASGGW